LVDEAVALSEAGRHAEAAAVGEQAVGLLRAIRRVPREELVPLLARAVLYHSTDLAAMGDLAGALRQATEALDLAQEVAAAGRGRRGSLPLAQANLAARLVQSGRAGDAVPLARAAAGSVDGLADRDTAWIQGTLALVLAAAGKDAEASAVSEHARNALPGQADPEPEHARALTNHANRLLQAGRRREAVDTVAEAVALHRSLVARNRLARLPGLAMALSNQALMLSKVSRWDESLVASEEAVALRREISAADPVAGRPGLASALSAYAIGLAGTDRTAEARPLMAESLENWRVLAAADGDAHLGKLAEAVSNYAFLAETDEERLRLYEEAVRLRRLLSARNRAVHLPWLSRALDRLSQQLAVAGRADSAADTGREAVELAREAFAANPAGFRPHLVFVLREQARRLDGAGRREAAAALRAEAAATEEV
jgi:tetratricopeptide (TPR) repeat protein